MTPNGQPQKPTVGNQLRVPFISKVLVVIMRAAIGMPFGGLLGLFVARATARNYTRIGLMIGLIVGGVAGAGLWDLLFSRYDHPGGR